MASIITHMILILLRNKKMVRSINRDFLDEVMLSASALSFLVLKFSVNRKDVILEINYTKSCSRDERVHSLLKMYHCKTSTKTIL